MYGRQHYSFTLKYISYTRMRSAGFIACIATMTVLAVLISGAVHMYINTVSSSAFASFGDYDSQVATQNSRVVDILTAEQKKKQAVAVTRGQGTIVDTFAKSAVKASTVIVSSNVHMEQLVGGKFPAKAEESTLSSHAAETLHVHIGDVVKLTLEDGTTYKVKVSGITINAARMNEDLVIAQLPQYFEGNPPDTWLINNDLASIAPYSSDGSTSFALRNQYVRKIVDVASGSSLTTLKFVQYSAFFMMILLVIVFAFANRKRLQERRKILIALTDKPFAASHSVALTDSVLTLMASACSAVIASVIAESCYRFVGALFNQVWTALDIRYVIGASVVISITLTFTVYVSEIVALHLHITSHQNAQMSHPTRWVLLSALGTLLTIVFIALRQILVLMNGHYAALFIGAVSIPALVIGGVTLCIRRYEIIGKLSEEIIWIRFFSLVLTFIMCFYASMYTSFTAYSINGIRGFAPDDDGYISAQGVSENTVKRLQKDFPKIMRSAYVLYMPDDSQGEIRAISHKGVSCADKLVETQEDMDACDLDLSAAVGIARKGEAAELLADSARPELVKNKSVNTIILQSHPDSMTVLKREAVHGVKPSKTLDYQFLTGMVVSENGAIYQKLGLRTSSIADVYIPHIYTYSPQEINELRSLILIQAPYALIQESNSAEFKDMQTKTYAWMLVATITALIAYVASLTAWESEQKRLFALSRLSGASWKMRLILIAPIVIPFMCVIVSAAVLGHLASYDYIPLIMSRGISVSRGHLWAISGCTVFAPIVTLLRQLKTR